MNVDECASRSGQKGSDCLDAIIMLHPGTADHFPGLPEALQNPAGQLGHDNLHGPRSTQPCEALPNISKIAQLAAHRSLTSNPRQAQCSAVALQGLQAPRPVLQGKAPDVFVVPLAAKVTAIDDHAVAMRAVLRTSQLQVPQP